MLRVFLVLSFLFLSFSSYAYEYPQQSTIVIGGEPGVVYIRGWIGPDLTERITSMDPTKIKRIELFLWPLKKLQRTSSIIRTIF